MEIIVAGAILLLTVIPPGSIKKPQAASQIIASKITPTTSSNITPTPTPTEKPLAPTTHTVEPGDTMDSIAIKYYGSSKYWTSLWNDNDFIKDPKIINSGMTLKIRNEKPTETEELKKELAALYEEINAPTPTPTSEPEAAVAGASTQIPQVAPSNLDEVYRQAGSKYGVPWEILYGLHHMETGGRDGAISSGYGTGAQGPLQFMPGTWAAYGADGNGDGVNDINNAVDAIHGAANYLATHGGVEQGLKSYGGNSDLVYSYARSRGWSQ